MTTAGLCSIEGEAAGAEGAGGGAGAALGGGAAALLDGGAGGAGGAAGGAASGAAAAGAEGAGGAAGGAGAAAGAEPEWLAHFSAEGGDAENPANRDWLKAKGFKTLDDVVKSYRDTEKTLRGGGNVKVPGEGAAPEEVAAFRKAIGVPEAADKYDVKMPEAMKDMELDGSFLDPMKKAAFDAGVPAGAFQKLADGFLAWQQDQLAAGKQAEDGAVAEVFKTWGAEKDAKIADVQRAARALNLTPAEIAGMQRGLALATGQPAGSGRMLELLAKLGAGMSEDGLIGGGKGGFGVTGEQAQAEINNLIANKDFQGKLSAKDPAAVARWNRLNAAVADWQERQERAAASRT